MTPDQDYELPYIPPKTIFPSPSDEDLFVPFMNRFYELFANVINQKDWRYFTMPIGSTASNIPNMATFGAFLLCVSGESDGMPTGVWALSKSTSTIAGEGLTPLSFQEGSVGDWAGILLTVTSTASNYQIAHNAAGIIGNFNFRFIGTI